MPRTFNFSEETDLITPDTFDPSEGRQKAKAEKYGCTRIWRHRYAILVSDLPKFVRREVEENGYRLIRIGSTTFKTSTWGLIKVART